MPAAFSDEEVVTYLAFVRETVTFKAIDGCVQRNIDSLNSPMIDTIKRMIKKKDWIAVENKMEISQEKVPG